MINDLNFMSHSILTSKRARKAWLTDLEKRCAAMPSRMNYKAAARKNAHEARAPVSGICALRTGSSPLIFDGRLSSTPPS